MFSGHPATHFRWLLWNGYMKIIKSVSPHCISLPWGEEWEWNVSFTMFPDLVMYFYTTHSAVLEIFKLINCQFPLFLYVLPLQISPPDCHVVAQNTLNKGHMNLFSNWPQTHTIFNEIKPLQRPLLHWIKSSFSLNPGQLSIVLFVFLCCRLFLSI